MKNFEVYKDLRSNPIYKVNDKFYIKKGSEIQPVPKFLQSWFKKWIEEKREDLIIKTKFSDFTKIKTK
tara:strand:+ start:1768 stop:1971 length:204 start_codon:yes stop_codon:yes gene_type:complete